MDSSVMIVYECVCKSMYRRYLLEPSGTVATMKTIGRLIYTVKIKQKEVISFIPESICQLMSESPMF